MCYSSKCVCLVSVLPWLLVFYLVVSVNLESVSGWCARLINVLAWLVLAFWLTLRLANWLTSQRDWDRLYTCFSFQCIFPTDPSGRLRRPSIAPLSSSPFLEIPTIDSMLGREECSGVLHSRSLNVYKFKSFHEGLDSLSLLVSYHIGMTRYSGWYWTGRIRR